MVVKQTGLICGWSYLIFQGLITQSNRVVNAKSLLTETDVSLILSSFVEGLNPYNHLCYMVKPHEQLVLVSSTPHSASTPNLSTS